MSNLRAMHLNSIDDLLAVDVAWDDLWWRSDTALPTTRAALIAQWVEQFAPKAEFRALVVESEGRLVAALPLVGCHIAKMIPAGELPANPWSCCGDLLLDPTVDVDSVMELLLESAGNLPWPLLWFSDAVADSSRWRTLLLACDRANILTEHHERYRVGRVEIAHDWEAYQRLLRKGHRQNMNRVVRRLNAEGDVQLDVHSSLAPTEVKSWLETVFAVEDQSWKGQAGTSVVGTPGAFAFYVRQAEQLAAWGQLEIAALQLNDRAIACLYGYRAKGVYFVNKIAYDPQFASFSPGQQLFYRLLENLHHHDGVHALDFMGPMTESLSRWEPTTYGIDRIALALHHPWGRAAIYAYKNWWPKVRQLRESFTPGNEPPVENPVGEPVGV